MPWCPKCKNEYREGILQCAECRILLVDSLEEAKQKETSEETADETVCEASGGWMEEERLQESTDEENGGAGDEPKNEVYHAYQNSAAKAEDNRSSAYTLLLVGGAGLLLDVLVLMGVLPVYANGGMSKYLVCGVMGAMFVLFLVLGGVSMKSSRILMIKAKSEDSLLAEITKWCEENLTAEQIDCEEADALLSEEGRYFVRAERMKEQIKDKFLNLDEAFLDHFVDDYYKKLFEEDEETADI